MAFHNLNEERREPGLEEAKQAPGVSPATSQPPNYYEQPSSGPPQQVYGYNQPSAGPPQQVYGYDQPGGYTGQPHVQSAMQQQHHTTVVVTQPMSMQQPQAVRWSSGMCDCFNDCAVCMCVTFLGPCAACQLASDLGEFSCVPFCVPNWMTVVRTKIRTQLGIQGTICDDCCMVSFCGPCTMCQIMREVKTAKLQGKL